MRLARWLILNLSRPLIPTCCPGRLPLMAPAVARSTSSKATSSLSNSPSSRFRRLTSTAAEETSASFSPNGRRVAYVRDHDLYFFDLDTNRETRITRDGSETLLNGTLSWVYWEEVFGRRDIGYWWAPDSQAIAYLQSDESQVDLAYFTDITPFSPRVIRQRYARAGGTNPRVRLGIIELKTPNTTWIQIKEPFEYIVRAKWLPDGRRLSLETMPRLQTQMSLYFADRKSGAATPHTHRN